MRFLLCYSLKKYPPLSGRAPMTKEPTTGVYAGGPPEAVGIRKKPSAVPAVAAKGAVATTVKSTMKPAVPAKESTMAAESQPDRNRRPIPAIIRRAIISVRIIGRAIPVAGSGIRDDVNTAGRRSQRSLSVGGRLIGIWCNRHSVGVRNHRSRAGRGGITRARGSRRRGSLGRQLHTLPLIEHGTDNLV